MPVLSFFTGLFTVFGFVVWLFSGFGFFSNFFGLYEPMKIFNTKSQQSITIERVKEPEKKVLKQGFEIQKKTPAAVKKNNSQGKSVSLNIIKSDHKSCEQFYKKRKNMLRQKIKSLYFNVLKKSGELFRNIKSRAKKGLEKIPVSYVAEKISLKRAADKHTTKELQAVIINIPRTFKSNTNSQARIILKGHKKYIKLCSPDLAEKLNSARSEFYLVKKHYKTQRRLYRKGLIPELDFQAVEQDMRLKEIECKKIEYRIQGTRYEIPRNAVLKVRDKEFVNQGQVLFEYNNQEYVCLKMQLSKKDYYYLITGAGILRVNKEPIPQDAITHIKQYGPGDKSHTLMAGVFVKRKYMEKYLSNSADNQRVISLFFDKYDLSLPRITGTNRILCSQQAKLQWMDGRVIKARYDGKIECNIDLNLRTDTRKSQVIYKYDNRVSQMEVLIARQKQDYHYFLKNRFKKYPKVFTKAKRDQAESLYEIAKDRLYRARSECGQLYDQNVCSANILKVFRKNGLVQQGEPLVIIGTPDLYKIVVEVDPENFKKINLHTRVDIFAEGLGRIGSGEVIKKRTVSDDSKKGTVVSVRFFDKDQILKNRGSGLAVETVFTGLLYQDLSAKLVRLSNAKYSAAQRLLYKHSKK